MSQAEDNKARGQIIKQLFDRCVDLTAEQQKACVQQADVTDDIKNHVLKLLQHATNEIDLTQAVVDSVQVSLDIKPMTAGMQIGAYELIKPLGFGGQGEVWLASRTDGNFEHQVAIKFLKPLHSQSDINRFQSERELLASLRHPNIAQLLDGGELRDNRPYMVLELVEGLPLLDYCQQQQFSLKQYLTCFLQICDAISYAHSHSVIHRDIKPSNIYVTHDGTVKLLDFGIAKYVDIDEVKTMTLPLMTLAYSSPEQVTGAPVSTATDIYSLGLLLYEMLTGQRAQAVNSEVPAELIHEITDQSPILPSQLIQNMDFKRSYNKKQLQGDLDNLILMAVRKEPERRYATVTGMVKDIKNYMDGKPLMAVGDSKIYIINKFFKRNPVVTYLSAAVLAFMVALPLTLISNQRQLTTERDKALLAQQQAEEQSIIANRTTDFLINILESASPLANQGEAINLDDVLAGAERQLSVGLDEQPLIKATLLSKLAGIQHQLGNTDQAVVHYKKVLQLHIQANNEVGQAFVLGQLGIMSHFNHDQVAANQYKLQALALTDVIDDPKDLAWHHARMATIDGFLGNQSEAENRLIQTLAALNQQGIDDAELLGRIYNELSLVTADLQLGLNYISMAVELAEKLNGRMHPLYQSRKQSKALKLKVLGEYEEAESLLLEVQEDSRKIFTEEHPVYSSVTAELGALYHDKGRFSEVEQIYLEAIDISQRNSSNRSLNYVLQINNLAYLYEDMGRYDEAEPLYRESVKLRQKYHSASPIRVASSQGNLARLLAKIGKHQESQSLVDLIMPVYQQHNRSNRQNHITAIANLLGLNPASCDQVITQIEEILPAVQSLSETSWRRMQSELWLGELASKCAHQDLASQLIQAAKDKAVIIYSKGSEGQRIIQNKANQLLAGSGQI